MVRIGSLIIYSRILSSEPDDVFRGKLTCILNYFQRIRVQSASSRPSDPSARRSSHVQTQLCPSHHLVQVVLPCYCSCVLRGSSQLPQAADEDDPVPRRDDRGRRRAPPGRLRQQIYWWRRAHARLRPRRDSLSAVARCPVPSSLRSPQNSS